MSKRRGPEQNWYALSLEERTRLLTAAGDVHNPDVVARRRLNKVVRREKKAAKTRVDESNLAETGSASSAPSRSS